MVYVYYDLPLVTMAVGDVVHFTEPTNEEESLRTDASAIVARPGRTKGRIAAVATGATVVEAVGEPVPFSLNVVVR